MIRSVLGVTCAIIITAALYLLVQDFLNAKEVPTTKVVAGTLEGVSVSSGIFSADTTSELVLSDGTHVTVKGEVNFWRRGSEVVHLVPVGEKADNQDKAKSKWCIGDKCFWQK